MYQDYPWKSTEENRIVVSSGEGIWVAVKLQSEINFTKYLLLLNFVSYVCIIKLEKIMSINSLKSNGHTRLNYIISPLLYIPECQKTMCITALIFNKFVFSMKDHLVQVLYPGCTINLGSPNGIQALFLPMISFKLKLLNRELWKPSFWFIQLRTDFKDLNPNYM